MDGATHFIEVVKTGSRQVQYPLQELRFLDRNLKMTFNAPTLKTIAVFKIKFKAHIKEPLSEMYKTNQ